MSWRFGLGQLGADNTTMQIGTTMECRASASSNIPSIHIPGDFFSPDKLCNSSSSLYQTVRLNPGQKTRSVTTKDERAVFLFAGCLSGPPLPSSSSGCLK